MLDLIRNLLFYFSKYKCLVHTVAGNDEYFNVAGKLDSQGIKYKVRTRYSARYESSGIGMDSSQYDFFVQKPDKDLAYQVIQN